MGQPSVFANPGTVTVRGREFVVPSPTASDLNRVHERMRELAQRQCVSPLAYVNANAEGLLPAVLAESLRAAVAMGSGGGTEPTRESVFRAYDSLDGVRFRLWYHARKALPELTRAEVDKLVDDENRYDVSDALAKATSPADGPADPKAPASGANSSPRSTGPNSSEG